MQSIADKINNILIKKKMTKMQLCRKINYASGNFSNMQKRDTYMTDVLQKIAYSMDCTLEINFIENDSMVNTINNEWYYNI